MSCIVKDKSTDLFVKRNIFLSLPPEWTNDINEAKVYTNSEGINTNNLSISPDNLEIIDVNIVPREEAERIVGLSQRLTWILEETEKACTTTSRGISRSLDVISQIRGL